ncbi:hypothetical protein RIF29_14873 [Crotalaria pallida]|uniref:Uncharacterized protein n=1 Tax=Crotalaria pallida TaxID=3830 RepID=A0AAN9FHY7_CROPI
MHKHVFLRIVQALGEHDEYFRMRVDERGREDLSPLQKCTSAIRMLAYASPADSLDDYVVGKQAGLYQSIERLCASEEEVDDKATKELSSYRRSIGTFVLKATKHKTKRYFGT